MDPYVTTTTTDVTSNYVTGEAVTVTAKKPKSSKKKKHKEASTSDPYGGSVNPYTDSTELTTLSKHKKKKDKKQPKSERSKKSKKSSTSSSKNTSNKSDDEDFADEFAYAHPVLEASGWEQLLAKDINKEHAHATGPHSTHQYAITGHESQIVTVAIPPGQDCQGEPGSMMYLTSDVSMKVSCGADCCGRCMGGESCCIVNFHNHASPSNPNQTGYAALVTNSPLAKVVPIDMNSAAVGGELIVQKGAYMASYGDVQITYSFDCNFIRCCCGGMGLVRQKIKGTGTAFLGAVGTIVQKVLAPGEVLLVDTNCLLAYAESCTFDLKRAGGLVGMIGGGEGIFNTSVKGPGLVVVQSMNMVMLLESLAAEKMYRR